MSSQTGPITASITIGGQALDDSFEIVSIDIEREVNRIPSASLVLSGPGGPDAQATLFGGGPFAPGAEVAISFQQADKRASMFAGLVTGLGLRVHNSVPELNITLRDKAVRLAGARHNQVFNDQTDAEAISKVVGDVSGLRMGDVPSTQPSHKALVQYDATDWDFIVSRADAQGLVIVMLDGVLSLKQPSLEGSAVRSFSFSLGEIAELDFDLDVTRQRTAVSGIAWDPQNLVAGAPATAPSYAVNQGGSDIALGSDALTLGAEQLVHMVPLPQAEVTSWTAGRMARERLALVRGRIGVPGILDLALLDLAGLTGLGDRFNGNALITGLRHRLDARGFATDIQFGLPAEPFGRTPDIADVPAKGLLPPIGGLQIGTVLNSGPDPDGEARVQVQIPAIAAPVPHPLWARVGRPDAGPAAGICFLPEIGDEVVLGFLNDDPRFPVVLGSLHGAKNAPPDDFKDTTKKGLVSRKGIRITLAETDLPSITIETKGGRKFLLDDDAGCITLSDKDGNTVSLDTNGVTIKSAKDLKIEANGTVTIKGSSIDLN